MENLKRRLKNLIKVTPKNGVHNKALVEAYEYILKILLECDPWINIEDQQPEIGQAVLICGIVANADRESYTVFESEYEGVTEEGEYKFKTYKIGFRSTLKKWQPLPPPPKNI